MKTINWVLGLGVAALALTACNKMGSGSGRELKTQKDKVSYGIGMDIGRSFKQQSLEAPDVDLTKVMAGIEDVLAGKKSALTDQELNQAMMAFQQQMMAKHDSVSRIKGDANSVSHS